jgi:hypothetical protein
LEQGTFAVLEAWRDLREGHIAILKVRVSLSHLVQWTSSRKVQATVLSDRFHWQEAHRLI